VRNAANVGPVPNINLALSRAGGAYIVVAHDDDVYLPTFLEREAALLDANPGAGMVHCAALVMDEHGGLTRLVRAYPDTVVRPRGEEFERYLEGHNVVCSTVMVRRTMYERVGLWEPKYLCTDFHLWLRLALHGDVGYVAEPLVHVRVHPDTVTNSLTPERWYADFMAIVNESVARAAASDPTIVDRLDALRHRAARAQGRRFFIAAAAETAKGRFARAHEYAAVLERFEPDGLPHGYVILARLLNNRPGRVLLRAIRGVWRASARLKSRTVADENLWLEG
jgi:glycosyltransferase involved in cell wall biosynthesis